MSAEHVTEENKESVDKMKSFFTDLQNIRDSTDGKIEDDPKVELILKKGITFQVEDEEISSVSSSGSSGCSSDDHDGDNELHGRLTDEEDFPENPN